MFDEVTIEVNPNSVDYSKLEEYKKTIREGLNVLGKKNLALILQLPVL